MKLVLAPLAGFTDAPFRRLCSEGGADLTYTEMVSAAALAHGSRPTLQLMETMEGEGDVGCQIFGAKETDVALAARMVSGRFSELNLNAGCPMTKITREGAGAKLVESPERIYRLLKAIAENTPLDVTLKTRLGPHPEQTNIFEIVDAAEKAGAKAIVLHARYTSQLHGGKVHLELLREVVQKSPLPVIGNGSVVDGSTLSAMAETGVAGVMIGRAALARPGIFRELKGESVEESLRSVAACERHLKYLLEFRRELCNRYPSDRILGEDALASVKMHTHLFRYFNGRPGAAALRARLNQVRTLSEIYEIMRQQRD
jgi:nifR3 family TIM-barrel protein